jgi:hypothetical protein
MYKLTEKMKKECSRRKWIYDNDWISNGVFAISTKLVINHYAYCNAENEYNENMKRVIPEKTTLEYKKTTKLFEVDKKLCREFITECGKKAWVDDYIISHFEIETLKGNDEFSPFTALFDLFVIMPMRRPKEATGNAWETENK